MAHKTETLLDLARNQKLRITSAVVDIVLAAALLKIWIKRLQRALAASENADQRCFSTKKTSLSQSPDVCFVVCRPHLTIISFALVLIPKSDFL